MELDYLMEKKVQLIVEIATKRYDHEITDLKNQVATLSRDLDSIRQNVKTIRQEQVQQAQQPQVQYVQVPQQMQQQQPQFVQQQVQMQAPVAQAAAAPIANETQSMRMARTGNYKPEDVSVDKFFYYGNKK